MGYGVDPETRSQARQVAYWLRRCSETNGTAWSCNNCPFDDGENNCVDEIRVIAAGLIERLAGIERR